jgi:hypothetical protein
MRGIRIYPHTIVNPVPIGGNQPASILQHPVPIGGNQPASILQHPVPIGGNQPASILQRLSRGAKWRQKHLIMCLSGLAQA